MVRHGSEAEVQDGSQHAASSSQASSPTDGLGEGDREAWEQARGEAQELQGGEQPQEGCDCVLPAGGRLLLCGLHVGAVSQRLVRNIHSHGGILWREPRWTGCRLAKEQQQQRCSTAAAECCVDVTQPLNTLETYLLMFLTCERGRRGSAAQRNARDARRDRGANAAADRRAQGSNSGVKPELCD